MDDAALVAGTLAGRQDCFEALVERHQRAVHGLAYRWLGDHAAAGEVVQATFVQAYTHLADFRGDASFRSWLCGIALNEVRSEIRARRRMPMVALDDVPESVLLQADAAVTESALRHRLTRSIDRLPPRQRTVVTLRLAADLPFKEIARLEGISENAAKVSYHLAIKRLREWLGRT